MKNLKYAKILTVFISVFLFAYITQSQSVKVLPLQPSEILNRQITLGAHSKMSLQDMFREALASARVPGGIVEVRDCQEMPKKEMKARETTLSSALDLMTTDSRYKWAINEGVVEMFPAKGSASFLNTHISEFKMEKATSVTGALDLLLHLPEVKLQRTKTNMNEIATSIGMVGIKRNIGGVPEASGSVRVHLKNTTFREALNSIVRMHGQAVWAYTESSCKGKKTFQIDFIVR